MRFLVAIALLIPTACLALGADSQEFVGVSKDGKLTNIEFVSDPKEWTGNNWIYGSSNSPKFRYCWSNEKPIDASDPQFSPRQSTHFVCTSKWGAKPTVFYKHGNYNYSEKTGFRYKKAMIYYEKLGYEKDALIEYYICDKGCNTTMPLFIFEVSFDAC
jgi:hypothetical protein